MPIDDPSSDPESGRSAPPTALDDLGLGAWIDVAGRPLADVDDLVLAVARRRGVTPNAVEEELAAVDAAFDVDAVYVAPSD